MENKGKILTLKLEFIRIIQMFGSIKSDSDTQAGRLVEEEESWLYRYYIWFTLPSSGTSYCTSNVSVRKNFVVRNEHVSVPVVTFAYFAAHIIPCFTPWQLSGKVTSKFTSCSSLF